MNLVREYVTCMDELSQIHDFSIQKVEFLQKLMDVYVKPNHGISHSMTDKIHEAMIKIRKDNENLPRLILDLKSSLDVVNNTHPFPDPHLLICRVQLFQLRTMEQNELAIIAESNNKAILVFTVVTIIFLPLSFFTVGHHFELHYHFSSPDHGMQFPNMQSSPNSFQERVLTSLLLVILRNEHSRSR